MQRNALHPPSPLVRGNQKGYPFLGAKKEPSIGRLSFFARLANVVELQGHRALLVRGVILVKNTLCSSLVDRLHCDLVSALGLGAIAFSGSRLELLECGPQCRLVGLVALVTHTRHENALLGRLDIRQTKHLLRLEFAPADKKSTVQNGILTKNARNCKYFFEIFRFFCMTQNFVATIREKNKI